MSRVTFGVTLNDGTHFDLVHPSFEIFVAMMQASTTADSSLLEARIATRDGYGIVQDGGRVQLRKSAIAAVWESGVESR